MSSAVIACTTRKIWINLEFVPFQKLAFLRLFYLFVLRLRLILQLDLCLMRICFVTFVVNDAQRGFRHANMLIITLEIDFNSQTCHNILFATVFNLYKQNDSS